MGAQANEQVNQQPNKIHVSSGVHMTFLYGKKNGISFECRHTETETERWGEREKIVKNFHRHFVHQNIELENELQTKGQVLKVNSYS